MIFDNNVKKEEKNEGMEIVEKASEIILLLSVLAVGGAVKETSEALGDGYETVKSGVKESYESIKGGVKKGLNVLQEGIQSGWESVQDKIEYINPFANNNTLHHSAQLIQTEPIPVLKLKQKQENCV